MPGGEGATTATLLRNLSDRQYEKRKLAALEIETRSSAPCQRCCLQELVAGLSNVGVLCQSCDDASLPTCIHMLFAMISTLLSSMRRTCTVRRTWCHAVDAL